MLSRLDELFDVTHGNKLDMNKMVASDDGIAFVGRRGGNQGISGYVERIDGLEPFPAGLITVALGGSKLLAAFVQQHPFYTAQNVAVLRPKDVGMGLRDRLFYAMCITRNRFRYTAFGREANRSLGTVGLPSQVPDWAASIDVPSVASIDISKLVPAGEVAASRGGSGLIPVSEVFDVKYGNSLELNRLDRADAPNGVNFVGRSANNNGVTARVMAPEETVVNPAGYLTVALGGSVLSTFVQDEPFLSGRDIAVLSPKDSSMSFPERLWWAKIISTNAYRFSYGRQANRTLASIRVPAAIPAFVADVIAKVQTNSLYESQRSASE